MNRGNNMFTKFDEERVSKQNPFFAANDRAKRNAANKDNFTAYEIECAEYFKTLAEEVFFGCNVYINFNVKNITVKINKPTARQRCTKGFVQLETDLDKQEITVKVHKNGNRIYTFPRI